MAIGNDFTAESVHEGDLLGPAPDQHFGIETGTVGWDDTPDYVEQGTDDNDGVTLVRVQLYRGRRPRQKIEEGKAGGYHVLAQIAGPIWRIPRKGERCLVAFPGGQSQTPGAAVIFAWLDKSPSNQFNPTKAKLDVGPDYDLVLKGRSVTLTDYDNRFITVGPQGIYIQDKDGTGVSIANGAVVIGAVSGGSMSSVLQLTGSEATLAHGMGFLKLAGDNADITGMNVRIQGGAGYFATLMCFIGPGAQMAPGVNNALYGPTGIAGIASTTVYFSP